MPIRKRRIIIVFLLLPILYFGQVSFSIALRGQLTQDTIKKRTSIINQIFQSDNLIILAESAGCFHNYYQEYIFIKNNNKYAVTYKMNNRFEKKSSGEIKTYSITKEKLNSIRELCLHGLNIGGGLCTTTDYFSLSNGKNITHFMDARCDDNDDIMRKLAYIIGVLQKK